MVKKPLTDDEIKELIREGETPDSMEADVEESSITEEQIERFKKIYSDYKSGKIKIECTDEDKKRIIKRYIQLMREAGETDDEIEQFMKENPIKFIE